MKKLSKKTKLLFITILTTSITLLKEELDDYICDTFQEQNIIGDIDIEEYENISDWFQTQFPTKKNKS